MKTDDVQAPGVKPLKTIGQYFSDWEGHTFGYGYGTGEPHTLAALKNLMSSVPMDGAYDYRVLEEKVTPAVAWLLLNTLHHANIFDYGVSPRYAWLTDRGKVLKTFIDSHTADDLGTICHRGSDHCEPDACNCGPTGYREGVKCPNPFWVGTEACR